MTPLANTFFCLIISYHYYFRHSQMKDSGDVMDCKKNEIISLDLIDTQIITKEL